MPIGGMETVGGHLLFYSVTPGCQEWNVEKVVDLFPESKYKQCLYCPRISTNPSRSIPPRRKRHGRPPYVSSLGGVDPRRHTSLRSYGCPGVGTIKYRRRSGVDVLYRYPLLLIVQEGRPQGRPMRHWRAGRQTYLLAYVTK